MKFRFYIREHLHIPMNPISRTIANSMKYITQKECKIKQIMRILAKSSHTQTKIYSESTQIDNLKQTADDVLFHDFNLSRCYATEIVARIG